MTLPRTPEPVVSGADLQAIAGALYPRAEEQAQEILRRLRRPAGSSARQPCVAVVGRFSAGKSRFLNTLLGSELLPVDTDIVRLGVCEIAYGRNHRFVKQVRDGAGRTRWQPAALDALLRVSEQHSRHPETDRPRDRYRIISPSDILRHLRLLDTPGYDSPVATRHPRWALDLVMQACKQADICLLLLRNPADSADVDVVADLMTVCPRLALVITKSDLWHPDDITVIAEDSADTMEQVLGYRPETFCISSLWQGAGAEERASMLREHPLSLYKQAPRNDWPRLVGFLRHEAVVTCAGRLIRLLREYRAAMEGVYALEQNYSRLSTCCCLAAMSLAHPLRTILWTC